MAEVLAEEEKSSRPGHILTPSTVGNFGNLHKLRGESAG